MDIRQATPADAEGIAHAHVQAWKRAYQGIFPAAFLDGLSVEPRAALWQQILQRDESVTYVAEHEGSITAFVNLGACRDAGALPSHAEIWALYAHPAAWGKGFGRALTEQALDHLSRQGFEQVSLWVLSRNHRGRHFYERAGFAVRPGGVKQITVAGSVVDELVYERSLQGTSGPRADQWRHQPGKP